MVTFVNEAKAPGHHAVASRVRKSIAIPLQGIVAAAHVPFRHYISTVRGHMSTAQRKNRDTSCPENHTQAQQAQPTKLTLALSASDSNSFMQLVSFNQRAINTQKATKLGTTDHDFPASFIPYQHVMLQV